MSEKTADEQDLIKQSEVFFISLDKLVKGMKLYQGKGALVEQLLNDTYKKSQDFVKEERTFKVSPVGPMVASEPLADEGKNPAYFFQLYCDGVRELTFLPNVEKEELRQLAFVFNGDYRGSQDDMVTTLWKKELKKIRYYAVDTLGVQVDDQGEMELLSRQGDALQSSEDGEDMTMSSSDMRLLRAESSLIWVKNCFAPAAATGAIKEMAEQLELKNNADISRFIAISLRAMEQDPSCSNMVDNVWLAYTKNGAKKEMSTVVDTLKVLIQKGVSKASVLLNQMFQRENLDRLAPWLDTSPALLESISSLLELEDFDSELLVVLLKKLPIGDARNELLKKISDSGVDMTEFYLNNLQSDKEEMVIDAIKALGQIGSDQALEALSGAMSHNLGQVRAAAIKAMNKRYIPSARKPLVRLLKDPDSDLRRRALEILGTSEDKTIGSALLGVMKMGDFIKRPMEEQREFFIVLGRFPSASTMSFFAEILKEKSMLSRNNTVQERQMLAVEALRESNSPDALPALQKASKSWYLPSAVKESIKAAIAAKK
ncbi:MAG: HEAT repeat domain-containing protein [Myxococcota bacterium]|nr:HEAT repeat domain-containing protein [Myxococcota bacterium]